MLINYFLNLKWDFTLVEARVFISSSYNGFILPKHQGKIKHLYNTTIVILAITQHTADKIQQNEDCPNMCVCTFLTYCPVAVQLNILNVHLLIRSFVSV